MASKKARVGRPPNPGGAKRHVAVYVAPAEYTRFEAAASSHPSVSAWAGDVLIREAKKLLGE